jgi:hypothetical protein
MTDQLPSPDFLRSLAQNDYMIDGWMLEDGKRLEAIADEIERLRAVVDKLPKTADGVVVVAGDTVWLCGDDGYIEPYMVCFFVMDGDSPDATKYTAELYEVTGDGVKLLGACADVEACYSTRVAAAGAKGGG